MTKGTEAVYHLTDKNTPMASHEFWVPEIREQMPITSISIGDRYRKDLGDIRELVASVIDFGGWF